MLFTSRGDYVDAETKHFELLKEQYRNDLYALVRFFLTFLGFSLLSVEVQDCILLLVLLFMA